MTTAAQLAVGDDPDAVPRARRFTAEVLQGHAACSDAQLAVTELVTNALLHGEHPVVVRVLPTSDTVRIEVHDSGRAVPVQPRPNHDAMTGRGLALVATLARAWGVVPDETGKTVWAELSDAAELESAPPADYRPPVPAWQHTTRHERTYEVNLGWVPTDLLMAAKSHIDNVVRELTLMKGESRTSGAALPPAMATLVRTVTEEFAEARNEIKSQALDAARRGDRYTDLVLHLPLEAADAAERYLAALEDADRHARTAKLLTLAPPRSHQAFRRWYIGRIAEQLHAYARGDEPPVASPFPEVLADEVDRLSMLEDSTARLELLQRVTGELTGADTVQDIARTIADNAVRFSGVEAVRVFVVTADETLRSVAWRGEGEDASLGQVYDEFPLDSELPGAAVVRTRTPLFLRTLEQIYAAFPDLRGYYDGERSLHIVPLLVGDHVLGLLATTFAGGQLTEDIETEFMQSLADALAQALERAQALAAAHEANVRMALVADASVALSASLDFDATLKAVTSLTVPALADWAVVQLLREGRLETVALHHFDPARVEWANSMAGRYPTDMASPTGAPNVIRTGISEVYPVIPAELIEAAAVDDEHLSLLRELGLSSAVVVPLTGRSGVLGAFTLIYAESGRRYSNDDLTLLEDLARRAALALETADTLREQSGRLANVLQVSDAAQRAILAPPPPQIGPVRLAARYVSAAREALVGGDLYEVVSRPGAVRMLIGDVRGKGLGAVRTATIVLGEFRAAASDLDDLAEVAVQIDRRLRPYLGDEDFVTAMLAEIRDDGSYAIASCGHPGPLLVQGGVITEITIDHSLPLGLGAAPAVQTGTLSPGERILLFTDGALEARDRNGTFVDLISVVAPVATAPLDSALDEVLSALRRMTGQDLGDDLALLLAEYRP